MAKSIHSTTTFPNISRRMRLAGFEPAKRQSTRYSSRNMVVPKPEYRPGTMFCTERKIIKRLGFLIPSERRVLNQIVDTLDVIDAADRQWLLVPADTQLLHSLAMYESWAADLEPQDDDDKDNDAGGWYEGGYTEDHELEHAE